ISYRPNTRADPSPHMPSPEVLPPLQQRYRVVILSGNSLRSSSNNERARSRMTVKLYAFTCGTVTGEFGHLMEGGEGEITVPIPVFLIEHPKGRLLFDTGLHPDCQHDPAGRLGPRLARLFRVGFQPGEESSARLEAIDRDPGEIDLIINSHF